MTCVTVSAATLDPSATVGHGDGIRSVRVRGFGAEGPAGGQHGASTALAAALLMKYPKRGLIFDSRASLEAYRGMSVEFM
jgi:hypothetical protein